MEDEVVILEVKPKIFDVRNEPAGKCTFRLCYKKELYDVNQPITHKPDITRKTRMITHAADSGGFGVKNAEY